MELYSLESITQRAPRDCRADKLQNWFTKALPSLNTEEAQQLTLHKRAERLSTVLSIYLFTAFNGAKAFTRYTQESLQKLDCKECFAPVTTDIRSPEYH